MPEYPAMDFEASPTPISRAAFVLGFASCRNKTLEEK